jgi:hypothetical protein
MTQMTQMTQMTEASMQIYSLQLLINMTPPWALLLPALFAPLKRDTELQL